MGEALSRKEMIRGPGINRDLTHLGTHHVLPSLASFSNQESEADVNQLIFIQEPLNGRAFG